MFTPPANPVFVELYSGVTLGPKDSITSRELSFESLSTIIMSDSIVCFSKEPTERGSKLASFQFKTTTATNDFDMVLFYNESLKLPMKHLISKKNRALLIELVRTDFKLRYQGSILGYTWSLLKPLLMFVILYIVFVKFLKIGKGIEHYPVYLLLGIVLWGFFTEMTSQSLGSIVGRGDLIRKIKIPRWIIVISSSVSALINLFLNLVVIIIFIILNKVDLHASSLLLVFSLVELYVFSLGVSLLLSAAYVKYRDISYIWEVVLQAGFYATPILYPLTLIPNITVQKILLINPIAQAVQTARYNVVTTQTVTSTVISDNKLYIMLPILITLATLLVGALYFKKESKYFAENI